MATDRNRSFWPIPLAAALLTWPAIWNGYPIVFADTGTYLSQAIHRYLGWDRPPFYSLFMMPLHLTITTWPVVAAQALLTAWVLFQVVRVLWPALDTRWLPALVLPLAAGTWLPFLVSELTPDLLTPLLVLVLCVLALAPADTVGRNTRLGLVGLATFMIAAQQSSVVLSVALVTILLALKRSFIAVVPPLLAILALVGVNWAGHGRAAVAPFGNVFMLARVIYDGPGLAVLRRECPDAGWRLCPFRDRLPPTSDDFLWAADGPVFLAGGHKAVSAEADAIIAAALRADPGAELRAVLRNATEQLGRFESGDGLEPWPVQVTPWIERDFPAAEAAAYAAGLQARGLLALPPWLKAAHAILAMAGVAVCVLLLPLAARRRHAAAGFLTIALIVVPLSAAITGGLSTPHDRYQSRIMWLPAWVAALAAGSLAGRRA